MLFGQQMGFTNVMLEGDALVVINKILQPSSSLSNIGNLIDEVKGLMRNYICCRVQHIRREANEAAHLLVKSALSLEEDLYRVIISNCNFIS